MWLGGDLFAPVERAPRTPGEYGQLEIEREGLRWRLDLRCEPGLPGSTRLRSEITNVSSRGVALAGWGSSPGTMVLLVTPGGRKLFDPRWDTPRPIPVIAAGGTVVADIPLGRLPLVNLEDWGERPVRRLRGLGDPRLDREDHLWLMVSLHPVRGEPIRPRPLPLPLRAWREPGYRRDFADDLSRLYSTEMLYRPGRILVGLGRELRMEDARRIVLSRGLEVCSSRLWPHTGFLEVSAPPGREAQVAAELEAEGLARVALRDPIVSGFGV
jgi:hypothetical protein